jgi:phosphomannomutase
MVLRKNPLPAFKAYDIRGQVPQDLNPRLANRLGRAFAEVVHCKRVVVGHDIRLSSPELCDALTEGLLAAGVDVLHLGQLGTEMIYYATFALESEGVDGGIVVTASHNPADYNGMKLVRQGARPISGDTGLFDIEARVATGDFKDAEKPGTLHRRDILSDYAFHILSYVDVSALKPFKVVTNAGNGGAGPIVDALKTHLPFTFEHVHHQPDGHFPNGVPNPLLPENHAPTAEAVRRVGADFGLAWDGDFDRCFFFDHEGNFVDGYYIVGLLTEAMLEKEPGATIIYEPRQVWNTEAILAERGGKGVVCKTGHAFIKERMRQEDALYGGEMSAHHYFKRFAYCDSGMIPWLVVAERMSQTGKSLRELVEDRARRFPVSGEINRRLEDADKAIAAVEARYVPSKEESTGDVEINRIDGLSVAFENWRFNLRKSNTEPLLRLNVETRGDPHLLEEKTQEVLAVIDEA